MIARIIALVVAGLALSAGVAYAATQLASSDGTHVCVNNTNGLMRVATTCRAGESPLTIGGGGDVQVTQNGTFTVPLGATGTGKTLPLTGVAIAGRCALVTPPPGFGTPFGLARALIEAEDGKTMDAFSLQAGTIGGQSLVIAPFANTTIAGLAFGSTSLIVTSNGATATITVGGFVDLDAGCTFLWQARGAELLEGHCEAKQSEKRPLRPSRAQGPAQVSLSSDQPGD